MFEVKNIVDYKYVKYIKVINNRGIIVFSVWMWLLDYLCKIYDIRNEDVFVYFDFLFVYVF